MLPAACLVTCSAQPLTRSPAAAPQLQNFQNAVALSHSGGKAGGGSAGGGWLLLVSQDRAIRAYGVSAEAASAEAHSAEELKAVSKVRSMAWGRGQTGGGAGRAGAIMTCCPVLLTWCKQQGRQPKAGKARPGRRAAPGSRHLFAPSSSSHPPPQPPKPGSSLLRGARGALLTYLRQFQDSLEKKPWACAAISTGKGAGRGGSGASKGGAGAQCMRASVLVSA